MVIEAYKALDDTMRSRCSNRTYEVGKLYCLPDDLNQFNGYEFFTTIADCCQSIYSPTPGSSDKLFKVEITGDVISENGIKYTNRIKIIKEIPETEIKSYLDKNKRRIIKRNNQNQLILLARYNLAMDKLIKSEYVAVRLECLKFEKYSKELSTDESWEIRAKLAQMGKYLNILYKDTDWRVRIEVAKLGKYLDKLENDPSIKVRKEVLKFKMKQQHNCT